MNIYKKTLILPLIGLLYTLVPIHIEPGYAIHIEPGYAISQTKFNDFQDSYDNIMTSSSSTGKNEAKELIRSLLAETWVVGSEESAQMTKWIEELGKKANIDIRPLMPDKYEVNKDIFNAAIKTLKQSLTSGLTSALMSGATTTFFALLPMILPMLGSDFNSSIIESIGQAFITGASIKGIQSIGNLVLEALQTNPSDRPSLHTQSIISFLAKQHVTPSGPIPVPAVVQSLPYIGDKLIGAAVPGWVNVFIGAGIALGSGHLINKAQRSPWIYAQYDKIKESTAPLRTKVTNLFNQGMTKVKNSLKALPGYLPSMPEITDFGFTEDDLVF